MNKMEANSEARSLEERLCLAWSRKLSRKGFVVRLGKVVLRAVGISFVSALPVNRIWQFAEGTNPPGGCQTWSLCGIFGTSCCSSCTGGGGISSCPSCATRGTSFWNACCVQSCCDDCYSINYYDCCSSITCSCPSSPTGPCFYCQNNNQQPAWCDSGKYVCTVAINTGHCECL